MTGTEIYKRSAAFEREAESIRLHAPQWKLLLAYDGQRSLAEVALSSEVAFIDALPLTEKFLGSGWIEELPITLDQYLKRTGAASASAVGSSVTPPVVLHEPKPAAQVSPAPTPAAPVAPAVIAAPVAAAPPMPDPFVRAEEPAPMGATVPPPPSPKPILPPPLKAPSPPPVPVVAVAPPVTAAPVQPVDRSRGPLRLKAVVDFIVSQVGNSSLGQLVVYRVFLRVPPHLLQAEDIASVHLLNDQSVVKTDELKQAIANSVMEVVKRPLPESVFAAA